AARLDGDGLRREHRRDRWRAPGRRSRVHDRRALCRRAHHAAAAGDRWEGPPHGAPRVRRIPAFVLAVALGNLLVPLNSTMIVVALPLIGRDLGADRVTLAWLVTSYLIAMASLQPIAGR